MQIMGNIHRYQGNKKNNNIVHVKSTKQKHLCTELTETIEVTVIEFCVFSYRKPEALIPIKL